MHRRRIRHIALLALAAVMTVGCGSASEEEVLPSPPQPGQETPIAFSGSLSEEGEVTRTDPADPTGLETVLPEGNKKFKVWAYKNVTSGYQTVMNGYTVNWVENSANTTTTNSAGWEYVGYTNLPNGTATTSGISQTIKYWDYGASNYNFFAYSLGKGYTTTGASPTTTYAQASAMTSAGYTLSGTDDELKACYISNKKTITPSASSGTEVELQFLHFASNVKMAFYETIPGYSVKEVKFYPDAGTSTQAGVAPCLFASLNALPTEGTYTVSFDETSGRAQVSAPTSATYGSNLAFGTALTYTADRDYHENLSDNSIKYIGRSSNQATPTDVATVLPNPSGADLHLKIDYTLLSRDGNGETIHVTGATATVPAAYAKWLPNYSYTYLFKISDNTNGSTGLNILGLSPITLDAVVNVDADGKQETVTTVTNPSITTYQKGSDYASTDEYNAGTIYVVVTTNGGLEELSALNAKLYKANVTVETGSTALVTETVVANAITNPEGAKDANGNSMTVTLVGSSDDDVLSFTNGIAAEDSPNGKAIVFGTDLVAKFTPEVTTTPPTLYYVFEYTDTTPEPDVKYYKVIKVASGS